MKKLMLSVCAALALPFLLAGCGRPGYENRLTELRSTVFSGSTETAEITAYSGFREQPFVADGKVGEVRDVLRIRLRTAAAGNFSVEIASEGKTYTGAFALNPVSHNLTVTVEMPRVTAKTLDVVLICGEIREPVTLENVTPEGICDYRKALAAAAAGMKDDIAEDSGEFYLRLMRENDRFYWFCAYVKSDRTTAVLLSAEDAKVIAKRSSR